ncbi:MAG: serine--tRNA ligase [Parvibaculales bacterium]
MHDIKAIRANPENFDELLARRGVAPQAVSLLAIDEKRRTAIATHQAFLTRRNEISKKIGQAKSADDESDVEELIEEMTALKGHIETTEDDQRPAQAELEIKLAELPNLPLDDVPDGQDETSNVEQRRTDGALPPQAAQHFEIGDALGEMDFEAAAQMSGARFVVLKGQLARLNRALANFMLDLHVNEFDYQEIVPPVLVRDEAVFGVGQLPKFADDLFCTKNGYWLTSTAEVTLSNMVREQIIEQEKLPLRMAALTPCFRSEAGAAGRDTRGMIRQHQFDKVELVSIVAQEDGAEELERKTACAEAVLQKLELPYRVMLLCAGDMGFAARKTFDLEVWLPGQQAFREISSISYCGDFQARRMQARYRAVGEKQTKFVHTLNGSGLAVGRTLVAVLENYLQENGAVAVPTILQPYMGGQKIIEAQNG